MRTWANCPKCNRQLQPSGVASMPDGSTLQVFQCDECSEPWEAAPGELIPCALTFAVDGQGQALHPDTGLPWAKSS